MKRIYSKPEARFVDINLIDTIMEPPGPLPHSGEESNVRVWDENADGQLPTGKSVWGDAEEEEK
ncbi:MAG: hypothetical protein J5548_06330 [Prevotella sp.]|nr:hypothetical protein [Prevotella sp.]